MDLTVAVEALSENASLVELVERQAQSVQTLATVDFGRRIVAARIGGERLPAIVITAGAHASEIEGIIAALRIIESLETDHVTYVVPNRDPLGMEGFSSTLQLASEEDEPPQTFDEVATVLRKGDVLYDDGDLIVSVFGNLGFASMHRRPGWKPWGHHVIYQRLRDLSHQDKDFARSIFGHRILIPVASPTIEGSADFGRAWTAVGAPDDVLHLNRFFDNPDALTEVSCVRALLNDVEPGLTLDLHAGTSNKFWLPFPLPQKNDNMTIEVARSMSDAVRAAGYATATLAELRTEGGISATFFDCYTDLGNGVTPYYTDDRGEGLNFMDYCRRFGVAVGTEAGQRAPLADRVEMVYLATIGGIRAWERNVDKSGLPV